MPLWLVIIVLGAAGSGWLFFRARDMESKNTLKKVNQGHKSVKKAAKAVAGKPSTIVGREPNYSDKEVGFSPDLPSSVARDLESIMKEKGM